MDLQLFGWWLVPLGAVWLRVVPCGFRLIPLDSVWFAFDSPKMAGHDVGMPDYLEGPQGRGCAPRRGGRRPPGRSQPSMPASRAFRPKVHTTKVLFQIPHPCIFGCHASFLRRKWPPPPGGSSRRGVPGLPQGKVVRSPPPFLLVLREPNGAQGGPRAIQMEQNGTTRNSHRIARNQACACWRFLAGWICRCLVGVWFHWPPFGSVWFHVVSV